MLAIPWQYAVKIPRRNGLGSWRALRVPCAKQPLGDYESMLLQLLLSGASEFQKTLPVYPVDFLVIMKFDATNDSLESCC